MGLGAGLTVGIVFLAVTNDCAYNTLDQHTNGSPRPEIRLAPITLGAPLACFGLIIYGWSVEKRVHWILPIIGTAVFGLSIVTFVLPTTTYLIEVFRQRAAGTVDASAVLRCLVGGVLPLCVNSLYARFGLGWGNTLLAFIALAFAPLPWLFYKKGEGLRERFHPSSN